MALFPAVVFGLITFWLHRRIVRATAMPRPWSIIADVALVYKLHIILGLTLFLITPFTRLVHIFTAPVHYLFRPYIEYRSRDRRVAPGNQPHRPGWAPVGVKDRDR